MSQTPLSPRTDRSESNLGPVENQPEQRQLAAPRRHYTARWFWYGSFLLLVFGPVTVRELPHELGRWYFAAAVSALDSSRLEQASHWIERALEINPAQLDYVLLQAEILFRTGRLDLCEQVLDRAIHIARPEQRLQVYLVRSDLHLKMHRWRAAVHDWENIASLAQLPHLTLRAPPKHSLLNSLAYMRALANENLDQALEEINLALTQESDNAAYLDTRGYIYYRLGLYNKALADLNRAVELAQEERSRQEFQLQQLRDLRVDPRAIDRQLSEVRRSYAVILYHRALVQDLFDAARAQQDYWEIQTLGFTPGPDLF